MDFDLVPKAEYYLGDGRGVKMMVDSGVIGNERFFVLMDKTGSLSVVTFTLIARSALVEVIMEYSRPENRKLGVQTGAPVDVETYEPIETLLGNFHSGPICGVAACPKDHTVVTCGRDGSVKLFDYANRKLISSRIFNSPATALIWVPEKVDRSCGHVLVGFENGTLRIFSVTRGALSLVSIMKPHVGAVTDICISMESMVLASASKDGTIWFYDCNYFNEDREMKPLRFIIPVPGAEKKFNAYCETLSWDPSGLRLLITCNDQILREVDASDFISQKEALPLHFETYLTEMPVYERVLKFPMVVTVSVKAAPGSPGPSSPSKEAVPESDAPNVAPEGGDVEAPPSPGGGMQQQQQQQQVSIVGMKVLCAKFSNERNSRKIFASCRLPDRNILCEYVLEDDTSAVELKYGLYASDRKDLPKHPAVTSISHSISGNYILLGTEDGSVIARPSNYIHVCTRVISHSSVVNYVTMSYDEKTIFSVGRDGLLVLNELQDVGTVEKAAKELWLDIDAGIFGDNLMKPATSSDAVEDAEMTISGSMYGTSLHIPIEPKDFDLVEELPLNTYSIEDDKQKRGHDQQLADAEDKKQLTRRLIRELQLEYKDLVQKNSLIPDAVRLSPEEMVVDPELVQMLSAEGEEQLEEVRKLCAYESEKAQKLKDKLYARLMDSVLVEYIPLSALEFPGKEKQAKSVVYSLRTRAMDSAVEDILESVRAQEKKKAIMEAKEKASKSLKHNSDLAYQEVRHRLHRDESLYESSQSAEKTKAKGTSAAERKVLRLERKERIAEHLSKKPNEEEDDIRDIEAIQLAEATLGDYKLKASDDYRIPVGQEVNMEKKRRQMVLLEESMIVLRLKFNEKFLALRHLKKELISSIQTDNCRLRSIDEELQKISRSENLWEPVLDASEFPDDREEVTEVELMAFKAARENTPWIKAIAHKNSSAVGNKTFVTVDLVTGDYNVMKMKADEQASTVQKDKKSNEDSAVYAEKRYFELDDRLLAAYARPGMKIEKSELSILELSIPSLITAKESKQLMLAKFSSSKSPILEHTVQDRFRKLEFEREMILKNIEQNVVKFRSGIDLLRISRHETNADIKLAELKLLALFQEYQLLLTFESRDISLQNKRLKCQKEKNEIQSNLNDLLRKLEVRTVESKDWQSKLQLIQLDMAQLVPSTNPYNDILNKVFKKKVKPAKATQNDDEEDEEEEEEEEDDEDDEEEEVEDICPPGCDKLLYEKVIRLRENRAENEEQLNAVVKIIDEIKRSIDRQKQKEKQIDKDTKQTELEIQQFQATKQAAVNEVEVFIPLNISQIYPFSRSGLISGPGDKKSEEDQNEVGILLNSQLREVVSEMSMNTHVLFQKQYVSFSFFRFRNYLLINRTSSFTFYLLSILVH